MRNYECSVVSLHPKLQVCEEHGSASQTGFPDNKCLILICIALEGTEGIGGAMAFEVVPAASGRLHSDQYSKIL